MPTNTEIVIGFIRGRSSLELEVRRIASDGLAPEAIVQLVKKKLLRAFAGTCTLQEIADLEHIHDTSDADWVEVARAFGKR